MVNFSEKLYLLGHPVGHSVSPEMHNHALENMRKAGFGKNHYYYEKIDVLPGALGEMILDLHAKKVRGVNITLPYKQRIMDCVTSCDEAVEVIGAANTLVWEQAGYRAYNTDIQGFESMLNTLCLGIDWKQMEVLVIGAGGAARAAIFTLIKKQVCRVAIMNRTEDRLRNLLAWAQRQGSKTIIHQAKEDQSYGMIINATSLGLEADDHLPIDLAKIRYKPYVLDIVYNKYGVTQWVMQASSLGLRALDGTKMLVEQAIASMALWQGRDYEEIKPFYDGLKACIYFSKKI